MVNYIIRWAKPILLLGSLLIVASFYFASQLGFSYKIERFFPEDDDDASFMTYFRDKVERDDLFLLVGIDNKASIYDSSFLAKVADFTQACKKLPAVESANAITSFKEPIKTPFGLSFRSLLHIDEPSRYTEDSLTISNDSRIYKNLVSTDQKALNVVLRTAPALSQDQADSLNNALEALLASYNFPQTHIAGVANTQSIFVAKIKKELLLYISLSILITALILFWLHRSFWGVLIPLVAVLAALLLFMAYLQLSGQLLDIMSSMFPMLMMIFGMSDLIHLQSKYIDEMEKGKSQADAMLFAIKEIGLALLLTSITTAVGFAVLLTSAIPAIRDFGVNAAVGVMIAYLLVVTFAAALLSLFPANKLQKLKSQRQNWDKLAFRLHHIALYRKNQVWGITLLVIIVCVYGMSRISTNTYLLGDLPENSKVRTDFIFFEDRFSGVRSLELAVLPAKGKHLFDPDVLLEIDKVDNYLSKTHDLGGIQSPAVLFKSLNKSWSGGLQSAFTLPEDSSLYASFGKLVQKDSRLTQFAVFDKNAEIGRITGRIKDSGSDSLSMVMAGTRNWIAQNTDTEKVAFRFTGSGLMVDKNNLYLRNNLIQSLLFAFFAVGCIFALLFRDWRMLFVSIAPNLIPMLIAAAALGYSGIELKAVTSVIFTVSFGIAVDDTIHFLTRYKLERSRGSSVDDAIRETFIVSGKAIILTTIILVFGFVSLIFSDFTGTYYVGILVCITLVSALLADLFLIPQLLYWINPSSRQPGLDKQAKL